MCVHTAAETIVPGGELRHLGRGGGASWNGPFMSSDGYLGKLSVQIWGLVLFCCCEMTPMCVSIADETWEPSDYKQGNQKTLNSSFFSFLFFFSWTGTDCSGYVPGSWAKKASSCWGEPQQLHLLCITLSLCLRFFKSLETLIQVGPVRFSFSRTGAN